MLLGFSISAGVSQTVVAIKTTPALLSLREHTPIVYYNHGKIDTKLWRQMSVEMREGCGRGEGGIG